MEATKKCKSCGRVLPLSQFGQHGKSKDGYKSSCKECNTKYIKSWKINRSLNEEGLEYFTEEALFKELKRRGYEGELTKKLSL